jgi:hypothetical protein
MLTIEEREPLLHDWYNRFGVDSLIHICANKDDYITRLCRANRQEANSYKASTKALLEAAASALQQLQAAKDFYAVEEVMMLLQATINNVREDEPC